MVKILDKEYQRAYKEISIIIESLEDNIKNKIPKEKIEFYKNHMDNEHKFKLDIEKELAEQNILYPTRCILANLFRDYIATAEDRTEIIKKEQEELKQIEDAKREKYNPDDIFKKMDTDKKKKVEVNENNTSTAVIEYKESFFIRFKNFIFKILHIKK